MSNRLSIRKPHNARRAGWRLCLAWFTALAFVLMVAGAASHTHDSTLAAHDCALCSAVVDKIADVPVPPVLVRHCELQSYRILASSAAPVAYATPNLLPPSCGPPHASA
jgi:hypothetical protein